MPDGAQRRWVVWALVPLLVVFVVVVLWLVLSEDSDETGVPDDGGVPATILERAAVAAVHVDGEACGRAQNGSGAVLADGVVVTNAHVVAGVTSPMVHTADGSSFPAVAVSFDADLDLAVLRVPDLAVEPLRLSPEDAVAGATGLVLGMPTDAVLESVPYRIERRVTLRVSDIYGDHPVERSALELSVVIRAGDSGGALLGPDGHVVGIVFAAERNGRALGYALTADVVAGVLSGPLDAAVDVGPCLDTV